MVHLHLTWRQSISHSFSFYRMITRSPLLYVQWAGFLTFFFKYSLLQLYIEKVLSYHLLPVFLLIEFKEERFPNNKITLLKWELDFEESMHQALQTFHFRHTFHWKSWVRLWRRLPHEPSTLSYLRRSWRGSRDSRSIWLITYSKKFCLDGWVAT